MDKSRLKGVAEADRNTKGRGSSREWWFSLGGEGYFSAEYKGKEG